MIRTVLLSSLLLVLCIYVQSTWLGAIAILGVVPDMALIVLIWVSYKNGAIEGSVSGFFSGLVEDFLSAAPWGFHAFMKTLVAALTSLLGGFFFADKLFLPLALGAGGTIAKALAAALLSLIFPTALHSYDFFGKALWVEVGYNALIAPLIFLLLTPLQGLLVTKRGRE